jgi:YD repeat-containing protein
MKKKISIITLFFCVLINAQDLPKIIPPSPEASSLAKFVETPVNHYSGLQNINIPIHTIKQNGINIPINLSYHARGIKVEEIAPRVGLGWALNYGGSISRQIRGMADESPGFSYFNNSSNFTNMLNSQAVRSNILATESNYPEFDYYPDQFFFQANGTSGKFIFDYNDKKPVLQNFDDVKIEVVFNNSGSGSVPSEFKISGFIVIDKTGNKYYFGVTENGNRFAVNYDQTILNGKFSSVGGFQHLSSGSDSYPNAWQLMEIITPTGDKVEFHYGLETSFFYRRSYDIKEGVNVSSYFTKLQSNQYQLNEIIFNEGKLLFLNSLVEREDIDEGETLEKIKLIDTLGNVIKEVDLNYHYTTALSNTNQLWYLKNIDPKSSKRLFLSSVQEKGNNYQIKPPYTFEYNNILLPNRFSNSQDVWGYYNGANNGEYLTFFNYGSNNIDRTVNFLNSQSGILEKITYPTGGKTEFTYEQNIGFPFQGANNMSFLKINPSSNRQVALGHLESNDPLIYDGLFYIKPFTVGNNSNDFRTDWSLGSNDCNGGQDCKFQVYIYGAHLQPQKWITITPGNDIFMSSLPMGDYELRIKPINHTHNPQNDPLGSGFNVVLRWKEQDVNQNEYVYSQGKRIKRIEYYSSDNNLSHFKEYKYELPLDGGNSGFIFGSPDFYTFVPFNDNTSFNILSRHGVRGGSPFNTYQGNGIGYSHITEYFGDSNNNIGKVEYEFSIVYDSGRFFEFPYNPPTDNEWLRGKLLKTKYYKATETQNVFLKQKEIENKYVYASSIPDITSTQYESPSIFTPIPITLNLNQEVGSALKYLKSNAFFQLPLIRFTVKRDYFGVPVSPTEYQYKVFHLTGGTMGLKKTIQKDYLDSGVLISETENFYNYDDHYQLKKTKTTNSKGEVFLNEYTYPQDKNNTSTVFNLPLTNNHQFPVLVSKSFKDTNNNGIGDLNERLSYSNTVYTPFGANYLPQTIQTSKGNNSLEDRIIYHNYDSKGNPVEVSKKDGTHIVYIWGYNKTQPIAKIENTTFSQIANALGVSENILLNFNENNLSSINNLRNILPNARITTFTYTPLIGVTSVTDPRGRVMYYEYDGFNRLKYIKDHDGNILNKNEYNYKN